MTGPIGSEHPLADSIQPSIEASRTAADHAAKADATGRLDPGVIDAVLKDGFARLFVPREWGGGSHSFGQLVRSVAEIGEGCTSTAWFAALAATLGRFAAYLPDEGRRAVWESGPDSLVVGSLVPAGRAVRRGDGWRLSGSWPNVSSVEFSDWALLLALAETDHGEERRFFAVPRGAYEISETWAALGMRATGSHTVLVNDVFVPDERSFARQDLDDGRPYGVDSPSCAVALEGVSGLSFAAPVLGAARGARAEWRRLFMGTAPGAVRPTAMSAARNAAELAFARASVEIDAAGLLLERVATTADEGDRPEGWPARGARDCAMATELCVTAVDRLVRSAGTAALANERPLQRIWRDVSTASSHIMLSFPRAAVGYTRSVLH